MAIALRAVCVVTILLLSFPPPPPRTTVKGTVTDPDGAVIPNTDVVVHWDPAGHGAQIKDNVGIKEDVQVRTDMAGEFTVNLPPGFYDLFVSSSGFTPTCRKVRIKAGKHADYSFTLEVNAQVSKEVGPIVVSDP